MQISHLKCFRNVAKFSHLDSGYQHLIFIINKWSRFKAEFPKKSENDGLIAYSGHDVTFTLFSILNLRQKERF